MGYSCTAAAADALARIEAASQKIHGQHASGLVVNDKGEVVGFYERGRENWDGAITGKVMRACNEWGKLVPFVMHSEEKTYAKFAGGYRIEANGQVSRFPLMAKAALAAANDPYAPKGLTPL